MPILERSTYLTTNKKQVWLMQEERAGMILECAVRTTTGDHAEHIQWLLENDIQTTDVAWMNLYALFRHSDDAMRFYLAWGV